MLIISQQYSNQDKMFQTTKLQKKTWYSFYE